MQRQLRTRNHHNTSRTDLQVLVAGLASRRQRPQHDSFKIDSCSDSNCKNCRTVTSKCFECKPTYFLWETNPKLCVQLTELKSNTSKGPDLVTNKIVDCKSEQCLDCLTDYSKCTLCKPDFKVENSACVVDKYVATPIPKGNPKPKPERPGSNKFVNIFKPARATIQQILETIRTFVFRKDGTECKTCVASHKTTFKNGKVPQTIDVQSTFLEKFYGLQVVVVFKLPKEKATGGRLLQEETENFVTIVDDYSFIPDDKYDFSKGTRVFEVIVKLVHMVIFKFLLIGFCFGSSYRLHTVLSWFMVFRLLNGPYQLQPLKFTSSVTGWSFFGVFDQKIFEDKSKGKCKPFDTVTEASLECSIIENYGVDLILLLIFVAVTAVIAVVLKFRSKSESTSVPTSTDHQVFNSRPRFNISNYGMKWIIFFLSGASYEILTHSMMTLSMGYNSIIMGFSCFLSGGFLINYITHGFLLYKYAKTVPSSSTGFKLLEWAFSDYKTSEPRNNYLPVIQLVKTFLQCLFLVAILDSGIAQSVLILLVELANIGFIFKTVFRRRSL